MSEIHYFRYVDDRVLHYLSKEYNGKIQWLEVINCQGITDKGLLHLKDLNTLKVLKIEDLKRVKNPEKILEELQISLPKCQIEYPPYSDQK